MRDEKGYFWGGSGPPMKPLIDENKSLASTVFEFFQKCNPDTVAQIEVESGRQLTFGELKRLSLSTAQGLKSLGIRVNSVVTVVANNSQESQIVIFACYMIGATVSPMDPARPSETLAACLNLTKPELIYVEGNDSLKNVETALSLTDLKPKIVLSEPNHAYDSFQTLLKPLDPEFSPAEIPSPRDHIAMVLFTSGTSGVPKGAVLSDLYATFLDPVESLSKGDVFLTVSPLFWISGIYISLWSLWKEIRLVYFRKAPQDEIILQSVHRYKPSVWFATPTSLRRMLTLNRSDYDLSSVRLLVTGGETLSADNSLRIQKELFDDRATITQLYGMTETGNNTCNTPELNKHGSPGILKPGLCVKIENMDTKQCQGPGGEGEICVKHPYISQRYLNGGSGFDGEGWFRTGDVGFFDEDGYLFIVDRVKDLIQFKSYQIAPAEIENVLRAHPSVKEVAVFAIPNYEDYNHPAAYVVAENVSEKDLHDFVAQRLPEIKRLRGGIRFTDSIPKTPTGKLSRRLLRSKFMDEQLGN